MSTIRKFRPVVLAVALICAGAAPAFGKSYAAERFDARAAVQRGGTLEVTETIVFRFEDGTFSEVFREIPGRRTDGIEVVRAAMDGRDMPLGTEPGQVEVRRGSGVRVIWRLPAPVSASTHSFTLTYRVLGVVRRSEDGDLLSWRMLPSEHNYAVDAGTFEFTHPVRPALPPSIDTRRIDRRDILQADGRVVVSLEGIEKDGWADVRLLFPGGSLLDAPPQWQLAQARADALAPRWFGAAGIALTAGLILLWSVRQRYDSPGRHVRGPEFEADAPDDLPPAIAGAVASNGRVSFVHGMAALFDLADRGALTIEEEKGFMSSRGYVLQRTGRVRLAPHEEALLGAVFTHKGETEPRVSLSKARGRVASRLRDFRRAVQQELAAAGLIDPDRQQVHGRLGRVSVAILVIGLASFAGAAALVDTYRAWPLFVPGAVVLVALIGFMMQGAVTPLSNEGVRRRDRWRGYKRHLAKVAQHEQQLTADAPVRVLPLAIALGMASAWSKFLKAYPGAVPPWFRAMSPDERAAAFSAFIAYGGATSGGGSGGGGGAAGGGASGAS